MPNLIVVVVKPGSDAACAGNELAVIAATASTAEVKANFRRFVRVMSFLPSRASRYFPKGMF